MTKCTVCQDDFTPEIGVCESCGGGVVDVEAVMKVAAIAANYVDTKTHHPQIAGEVWRELVDAVRKMEANGGNDA